MKTKILTKEERKFALKCKEELEQELQDKTDKFLGERRYLKTKLFIVERELNRDCIPSE